jgi:hypothetical protein
VENNKNWKEFTHLRPGTKMTYKGRQYDENKDEHKLMKAVIAQMNSYNNKQERKRKNIQKMKVENAIEV